MILLHPCFLSCCALCPCDNCMASYVRSAGLSFVLRSPCPRSCCAPYACSLNNILLINCAKNDYSSDRRGPCPSIDGTRPFFFASTTPRYNLDEPHLHHSRAPTTKRSHFHPGTRGYRPLLNRRTLCVHRMSPTAPRPVLFLAAPPRSIVHGHWHTTRHHRQYSRVA